MSVLEELLTPRRTDNSLWAYSNNLVNNGGFVTSDQLFTNSWNFDYYCLNNPLVEVDDEDMTLSSSLMNLISSPPLMLQQPPTPPVPLSQADAFDNPFLDALREIVDPSLSSPRFPQSHQEEIDSRNFMYSSPLMEESKKTKGKSKKVEGQPSKNLMAERRRRRRLNDRLSMLRSIVPKISKMDRTSILGDAIDYMKDLLDKIKKVEEDEQETLHANEAMVRNSPKFEVERREKDTRVGISCGQKPGLLLSTVSAMEALGLEIHHCVISSFSDFSLQASCSEDVEQRECVRSEEIERALFMNAGYGGRCL